MRITGLLKLQHISVVAGAFPLQQKHKASLHKPGLCRSSLPFCSKLKDVPSPVAISISSFNCQFTSFLLYLMQPPFSAGHILCTPSSRGDSFHPTSSSGNSRFILLFLCYHLVQFLLIVPFFVVTTAMTADGVKQTFSQAKCFLRSYSINCNGGDAGVL